MNAIAAAVLALLGGEKIALSALGRAIAQRSSHKNGIKRVDRLLGNQALFGELDEIYAAIARYALGSMKKKRPVILLDWTEAGVNMCALTAAVPMEGRAITIYSRTCWLSEYTARAVEREFLEKLRTVLPPNCKPILVGDAGFRGPWMKDVRAMGWDFVTRIRGRTKVRRVGEAAWRHWKKLKSAGPVPRALGKYAVVKFRSVEVQLVIVDQRSHHRHRPSRKRSRIAPAQRARRAHREPWLLATSLTLSAKEVVRIYRARMQIELTFRDLKSHRFGWAFEDARCRSTARVAVQILLAALASLVAMLVGIAAEKAGLHRRFQANTISKRRVLSFVTLGCMVLRTQTPLDGPIPSLADFVLFVGIR